MSDVDRDTCEAISERLDRTVNDMQPPHCAVCDRPLTSRTELNRRIDWAMDVCDPCAEGPDDEDCWCSYSFYHGGDPRQFRPDEENSPVLIGVWRLACEAWARGEHVDPAPEEHGPWVDSETGEVTIGMRPSASSVGMCSGIRSFGMGAVYCDQHRQPDDAWRQWPVRMEDLVCGPQATGTDDGRAVLAGTE